MIIQFHKVRSSALTAIELICVVGIIAILVLLSIPRKSDWRARAERINCVNQLKQIGLASRLFANDNGDRYPMQIATNLGGSMEFKESNELFRHFQSLSNVIGTPKILVCPSDKARFPAESFARLRNINISYFLGIDAGETEPQMILSGDRNITGGIMTNGLLMIYRTNPAVSLTSELHNKVGYIVVSDGSIQQITSARLREQIRASFGTNEVIRLAIP